MFYLFAEGVEDDVRVRLEQGVEAGEHGAGEHWATEASYHGKWPDRVGGGVLPAM